MRVKKLLFYLLTALLGGCVPVVSLHPLFTKEDIIFEEKLLGTWVDEPEAPETTWQFKRFDKSDGKYENAYELVFEDERGKKGVFVAHLVRLRDKLFLDIYPSELPWQPEDQNEVQCPYNVFFLMPVHSFMKVDSIEPQLKMRITMDDEMEKLLKDNPDVVKHEWIEDRLILTAPTKELQSFVLKYADDKRVFTGEIALGRRDD
ncbi:MAG: hypothetical protein JSU70_07010 [Phycisphaerales bacterium]|nr:MAG: hypothetical protein JSU70_07010 [Phycisphaerales bacterium]